MPGPLLCSRSGERLARQNVDQALKAMADQANARLPKDQHIHLSAHLLRHTMLRKAADKYGVQYAMELAGHTSSRYIWQGQRTLSSLSGKDLHQKVDAPAGHATLHDVALFVWMLLDEAQRQAA